MIKEYFDKHIEVYKKLDLDSFAFGVKLVNDTILNGGKVFTCGNGGSALTASHYITDWQKTLPQKLGIPFYGTSLVDNIGSLTAIANDIAYSDVFSEQLKAVLGLKDLVIAVSGSGNSPNVINAIKYANEVGSQTLVIVGYEGGELKRISKHCIWIPSFDMQLCEDVQLMFGHIVVKNLSGNT